MGERQKDGNKVNLLKKNKKIDTSKTHFTVQNLMFPKKEIRKLKGGAGLTKLSAQSSFGAKMKLRLKYTAAQGKY